MNKYKYIGCFFDADDVLKAAQSFSQERLSKVIRYPHVTFAYMPERVDETLFGTAIRVVAVGYGKDDENEGLKVELFSEVPELQDIIQAIKVPHITISLSAQGEAVNTADLQFESISPMTIYGRYGGYLLDEETIRISRVDGEVS